jgi:hypothetical protein
MIRSTRPIKGFITPQTSRETNEEDEWFDELPNI